MKGMRDRRRNSSFFGKPSALTPKRESTIKGLMMKDFPSDMLKDINNTTSGRQASIMMNVKIPEREKRKKVSLFGINLSNYVIAADSLWKSRWDWFVIYLVIYTAIFIPYSFSFQHEKMALQEGLEYIIDVIFVVDIVFSFFTAYYDKRGDEIQGMRPARGVTFGVFCGQPFHKPSRSSLPLKERYLGPTDELTFAFIPIACAAHSFLFVLLFSL